MFLLNVERGDLAYIKKIVSALGKKKHIFDLNCSDPLGRSGLVIAIENENLEMMQFLLEAGIEIKVRNAMALTARQTIDVLKRPSISVGLPLGCHSGGLCRWCRMPAPL